MRIKYIAVIVCVCVCVFVCGQVVLASQSGTNVTTTSNPSGSVSNSSSNSTNLFFKVLQKISILGIFAVATHISGLYKLVIERRYNINHVSVELLSEKPASEKYYSFSCGTIKRNGQVIEQGMDSYYFYGVTVILNTSDSKKKIEDLVIKKLIIEIDDFRIEYVPQGEKFWGCGRCSVDVGEQEKCYILMRAPTVKRKEDRENLNVVEFFENPQHFKMYVLFFTNAKWTALFSFLCPKPRTILFKKKVYPLGEFGIGIDSDMIQGKKIKRWK